MSASCPKCDREFPEGTTICPDHNLALIQKTLASEPNTKEEPAKKPIVHAEELRSGAKIGEYTIEKKIGEGGMGEVWSGRHPQIGKRVAIKILSERLASNRKIITRFINEAKAVNEIQHRNIVDIFSFGELANGRPYLVMEFLSGMPLSDRIKQGGPMPFSEILSFWEQICRALQAAHARKIIHRDLKPDNLFLVIEERAPIFAKVLDFGIAKLTGEGEPSEDGQGQDRSLTATGAVMGTAAYMSPEQCEGAKAVDQRSDIYAMGIILFQMITGRTPFQEPGEGLGSIIAKHLHQEVPLASQMVSGRAVPPSVDAFLVRVLAKNPAERPQQSMDFYDELVAAIGDKKSEDAASVAGAKPIFASEQSGSHAKIAITKTGPTAVPSPKASTQTPLTIALIALLALSVIVFYASTKKSEPEETTTKTTLATPKALDPAAVASIIERANPQACFDAASNPTLKTEASFQLSIDPQGKVLSADPIAGGISPEVNACLSEKLKGLSFPASEAKTDLVHPFRFTTTTSPQSKPTQQQQMVKLVIVVTDPPGATISLDGQEKGTLADGAKSMVLDVPYSETKELNLTVEKEGYETAKKTVVPSFNDRIEITLKKQAKKIETKPVKYGEEGVLGPPKTP